MIDTIIAIDPGASGGIAWVDIAGVHCISMPETRGDVINLFKQTIGIIGDGADSIVAYHEKISGYIPDGGPSMMFQFGANCERVGCILETLGVRIIEITPQAWQKELGLGKKDLRKVPKCPEELKGAHRDKWKREHEEEIKTVKTHNAVAKREWKGKLKSEAQRRFPMSGVTLRTCDALLILDFAIRREQQPKHEELNLFS